MKTPSIKSNKTTTDSYSFHVSELELTNGLFLVDEDLEIEYKMRGMEMEIIAVYDCNGTEIISWIPHRKMTAIYQRGYDIPAFID